MKKSDSLIGLNTGYSRRHNPNKFEDKPIKYNPNHYPNGIIPTITITISALIALICVFSIKPLNNTISHESYLKQQWFNLIFYVFGGVMCILGLWAIGRTGFLSHARYGMLKFGRLIRFDILKRKIKYKVSYSAIDDVTSVDEWEQYIKKRKKSTRKIFILTLIVYSSIFGVSIILMSIMNAIINK